MTQPVSTTTLDLWNQIAAQINVPNNMAALETQSDLNVYAMINLIQDLQKATGITLSANTTNALAALKLVAAQTTVADADVTTPSTSKVIQATISRKSTTRNLQAAYYKLKAAFGLS
jgi:xylose isomerase